MKSKLYFRLELTGGAVVFGCASFLHFFYNLSGNAVIGALFGSVNESLWEHLKIFAIPYIAYGILTLLWARPVLAKFVPAKAAGVLVLWAGISAVYYLTKPLSGNLPLIIDIAAGLLFSIVAHLVSYKLTESEHNRGQFFYTGLMVILLVLMMLLCFSYFPPQCEIFRDPVSGTYGINSAEGYIGASVLDKIYGNIC